MGFNLESLEGTVPAGSIDSSEIADGSIVNADVNASAAIAGTKIDPDFGGQLITTTIPAAGNKVGLLVVQNDTTNNPDAVQIDQTGAGKSIDIDHSGNGTVIDLGNSGTGIALNLFQSGVLASGKYALSVYSAANQTTSPLVRINMDSASSTTNVLEINQDGTGDGLFIDHNSQGIVLNIDQDRPNHGSSQDWNTAQISRYNRGSSTGTTTGAALFIEIDADLSDTAVDNTHGIEILMDAAGGGDALRVDNNTGTSSAAPQNDAATGFIRVNVDGTSRRIPYYPAS